MVHALEEIRRSLVPGGILLDLRPLANQWPVEIVTRGEKRVMGRLTDLPTGPADDEASNQAIEEAARRGWYIQEKERIFSAYLYWDDPDEMAAYMAERWSDFVQLEEATLRAATSAWTIADEEKRVRIRMKMLLTRWRKQ
jgi:SAM-dependent methyltransferase